MTFSGTEERANFVSLTEENLLVIDDDDEFIAEAKTLFNGGLPTARAINDATQAIEAGKLRMVILGPSYAKEAALESVRSLRHQDPSMISIIVADEVTANLLRAAMRAGVSDVIEAPLTEEKIQAAISQFSSDVMARPAGGGGQKVDSSRGQIV